MLCNVQYYTYIAYTKEDAAEYESDNNFAYLTRQQVYIDMYTCCLVYIDVYPHSTTTQSFNSYEFTCVVGVWSYTAYDTLICGGCS